MILQDIGENKRCWLEWAIEKYSIKQWNGCWAWDRSKNSNGYGGIRINGKMEFVHRVSYSIFNQIDIPDGMCVCHTCDNPSCVNPKHLWLGTRKQNSEDMVSKGRVSRHGMGFVPGHRLSTGKRVRKLTEDQVREIRKSDWKLKDLADKYGVSLSQISNVRNGKRKQMVV